jgi:hypothetical protein
MAKTIKEVFGDKLVSSHIHAHDHGQLTLEEARGKVLIKVITTCLFRVS